MEKEQDKCYPQALREKLRENYEDCLRGWLNADQEYLVSYAEEIAAVKNIYQEFKGADDVSVQYLMKQERPLETVAQRLVENQKKDGSAKTLNAVCDMVDEDLQTEFAAMEESETVRAFLERYPKSSFDMMTPGGYVTLMPEDVSKLLAGKSTSGNPGCSGSDRKINAEELLNQIVCNANFHEGEWQLLNGDVPEQEQASMGMEVAMC